MGRLAGLFALVAGLIVLSATPAGADLSGTPSGGSTPPAPSQSSSGDPAHATDRNCSLYATAASFGLSCITGTGTSQSQTVQQILQGDSPDICWDQPLTDEQVRRDYGYPPVPGERYYLHTCLTGLDVNRSLYNQPDLQANQSAVAMPVGVGPCVPQPHHRYRPSDAGRCVMNLTTHQHTIVAAADGRDGRIPSILLTTQPSTRVRTNEWVAFVDAATDSDGNRLTRTPDYRVGAVTMWATMDRFIVYPYGPDTPPAIDCDGTARVSAEDTPDTKPDACWWRYPRSSAKQPGQTYPLRLEADWTVHYADADGTHTLAAFRKFDDVPLPVYDIQTLVIN